MKKFIYLLAFSFVFVNYSCASMARLFGVTCGCPHCKDGVCNCVSCNNPQVVYSGGVAQQQGTASFTEEQAKRRAMLDSLENIDYSIVDYDIPDVVERVRKPYTWDDDEIITASVDSLKRSFKKIAAGTETQYIHKEINSDVTNNDIYFYFNMKEDGVPGPLHLVVNYYADDPIEFHTLKIKVDGFDYKFKPVNIKRETQGKFYIERFDNAFKSENRDVAAALAKCLYPGAASNILLTSNSVSHRIYLSEEQVKHFRETYQLYRLLGGEL